MQLLLAETNELILSQKFSGALFLLIYLYANPYQLIQSITLSIIEPESRLGGLLNCFLLQKQTLLWRCISRNL